MKYSEVCEFYLPCFARIFLIEIKIWFSSLILFRGAFKSSWLLRWYNIEDDYSYYVLENWSVNLETYAWQYNTGENQSLGGLSPFNVFLDENQDKIEYKMGPCLRLLQRHGQKKSKGN